MTCSPYIFLHSTSDFCFAFPMLHNTIHFPHRSSRKNYEGPLSHDSSGAENRIMMFQESILFVCLDPCK